MTYFETAHNQVEILAFGYSRLGKFFQQEEKLLDQLLQICIDRRQRELQNPYQGLQSTSYHLWERVKGQHNDTDRILSSDTDMVRLSAIVVKDN